jgi:hypothetical protein
VAIPNRSYDGNANEIFLQRTNHSDPFGFFLARIIPPRIFFCFAENRRVKRSRHKTAVEADNIARW